MNVGLRQFALFLSLPLLLAAAPSVDPRESASEVAQAIEENFYDPALGRQIGEGLRDAASEGKFDGLTSGYAVAEALSAELGPLDGHLRVRWTEPSAAQADATQTEPRRPAVSWRERERRAGWGFTQASILPGNIALIEMSGFADIDFADPADPARGAADAALKLTADADAVIFDLRQNGGGSPAMVGYLVSAFTSADADIYNVFHSREGTESEAPGEFHPRPDLKRPVYILTSKLTASAAEAFPYTLQAADRATIVGEATRGAANPGGEIETASGYFVFVPFGTPVNPVTGGNWEGTGVAVDIAVAADEALATAQKAAFETLMETENAGPETAWVLEALKAEERGVAPARPLAAYSGHFGSSDVTVEEGALTLRRGVRSVRLRPLGGDSFYPEGQPERRVRFDVAEDRATALERESAFGSFSRSERTAEN
ncbi:hypothetical protein B5C34_01080 [Pacificimonas flava]|uniref:Tail specific protease domain-containing protein n=2 Tax=Pacificimonas TaxID=1960290 RepID=A0A219B1I0_9SPHN|nr:MULTISPECIES: S41 family peptidase [Pacificimonas]MBZ6378192.1 S41 family peptidase [Pacificimonas aurantium]OWV32180.1 hypothetical protein B5C34_01080 [Pacificimonas flava]